MPAPKSLPVALKPYRVSSPFGVIRTINGRNTPPHNGADWATPVGLRLEATISGKVSLVGGSLTHIWGYYVHLICDCPDKHVVEYHILRDLPKFKIGDRITLGQTIGYTGSSGSLNGKRYFPHHHHGTSRRGTYYNPLDIGWPSTAGDAATPLDNLEDDMFSDQDRANLTSVMLALGAGGLLPGKIKDDETVTAVVRKNRDTLAQIASRVVNVDRQVTGADGFEPTQTVAGRVIDLQKRAAVDVDKLAEAIVKRLPANGVTAAAVADEIAARLVK